MRTVIQTIQVADTDRKAATTTAEEAGFTVRPDPDHPTDGSLAILELQMTFPMAGPQDAEVDIQAMALRERCLEANGIDSTLVSYGVSNGGTQSRFIVTLKGHRELNSRTIMAENWSQFLDIWDQTYGGDLGEFDEEVFDVEIVGFAANDRR